MYRVISQKTVCCNSNEDLLPPLSGRLYYHGVSPLWCIWSTFAVLCSVVVIFLVWGR